MSFSIPPCEKYFFSQCSTPHSPRDKNKMLHNPCLLEKVVFWAFKTLLYPLGIGEKDFFVIFKCYDLANSKE
jgi:hypothetical protein